MVTHRAELRELNELSYGRLDSRISEVRHELRAELGTLRMEMHDGFADLKLAMANAETKSERRFGEVIKWSFLFWSGSFATAALALWRR